MSNTPPVRHIKAAPIRFLAAAYLKGRGLSFAAGPDPIVPTAALDAQKYSIGVDVVKHPNLTVCDADLSIFARDSFDHVFVGPRWAELPVRDRILSDLTDKLKIGGHLVIYLLGDEWNDETVQALLPAHWRAKDSRRTDDGQYCGIFKLIGRGQKKVESRAPILGKRACIARYGAIGDMVMLSPLIRRLHEDGYAVTLNVTPYCAEIARHNPYVANVVVQERDVVPNADLGDYWRFWVDQYDRYINLSESIEGKLLKVEGRRDFYTTKEWRQQQCGGVNYIDQTMRLGGYPDVVGARTEQHFSKSELRQARFNRDRVGRDRFVVLWGLKGSSHHKQYPLLEPTLKTWLAARPDASVILSGGPADAALQFEHPQVLPTAGRMSLRDAFALTTVVDLVVGPESALINTAACFDVAKIVFLSHSNEHNLCAYWRNYTALAPEGVSCFPCAQLHYSQNSCPLIQIENTQTKTRWTGPVCAGVGVTPERLIAALDHYYLAWQAARAEPMQIANSALVAA